MGDGGFVGKCRGLLGFLLENVGINKVLMLDILWVVGFFC